MKDLLFIVLCGLCAQSAAGDVRTTFGPRNVIASRGVEASAIIPAASAANNTGQACALLEVGNHGLFTTQSVSSAVYTEEREAYWSATQWSYPSCIFAPNSTEDVAFAIETLNATGAKFAIRGGGHSPFKTWSNIDDGVLLDLTNLKSITHDSDTETVTAGTGNLWIDIYNYTEPLGRVPVGGRVADAGMGLVIGGGLSHLSNEYGFVADNVVSFEVVLANSSILTANSSSNVDLFWALKGGSSNFGVVTQIEFKTYPLGQVWGGVIAFNNTYVDALMRAFAAYQVSGQLDVKSAIITDMVITQNINLVTFVYLAPVARPDAFSPFYDIPFIYDQTGFYDNLTALIGPPLDTHIPRWTWGSTTLYVDSDAFAEVAEICQNQTAKLSNITAGNMILLPQPISKSMVDACLSTGGNAMGITSAAQLWFTINLGWSNESDDAAVFSVMEETLKLLENSTKTQNVHDKFTFLNDAYTTQSVFRNYGSFNLQRLQNIANQYDPKGMFQTQVPGGFKISAFTDV